MDRELRTYSLVKLTPPKKSNLLLPREVTFLVGTNSDEIRSSSVAGEERVSPLFIQIGLYVPLLLCQRDTDHVPGKTF